MISRFFPGAASVLLLVTAAHAQTQQALYQAEQELRALEQTCPANSQYVGGPCDPSRMQAARNRVRDLRLAEAQAAIDTTPVPDLKPNERWVIVASRPDRDDAVDLAKQYQAKFPRVLVIGSENGNYAISIGRYNAVQKPSYATDLIQAKQIPAPIGFGHQSAVSGSRLANRRGTAAGGGGSCRTCEHCCRRRKLPNMNDGFARRRNGRLLLNEPIARRKSAEKSNVPVNSFGSKRLLNADSRLSRNSRTWDISLSRRLTLIWIGGISRKTAKRSR